MSKNKRAVAVATTLKFKILQRLSHSAKNLKRIKISFSAHQLESHLQCH
ncbi:hypothetical protein [uncultured Helicobacter sp.]|nr:hypothetical protein [uncultured Helicobacter sp.]